MSSKDSTEPSRGGPKGFQPLEDGM